MCVFLCGMQKCFTFAQIIKQCAIINMAVSKTKAKLVDVARQLFAKMGVENTTMNDIALASKKGRRTLYTYFKSKEDIYMAVVESELDILSDIMKRVVEKDISPDQKIIEMIYTRLDAVKEVVYRNGTLRATFFRDIWRVEKVRKRFDAKEIQLFKDVLREGVEKGVFQVDDIAKFLPIYLEKGILKNDPFQILDRNGVGQLIREAVFKGRGTRENLKCGICGEHGGEPSSVEFCHFAGLNYVSCSPFRVPIARLAAAHAALKEA